MVVPLGRGRSLDETSTEKSVLWVVMLRSPLLNTVRVATPATASTAIISNATPMVPTIRVPERSTAGSNPKTSDPARTRNTAR